MSEGLPSAPCYEPSTSGDGHFSQSRLTRMAMLAPMPTA
jgi:hypothetical protein